MKKVLKFIHSKCGETLVESVLAILIFTLASIIMLSMISAANNINQTAKDADREYFDQLVSAELASGTATQGEVTFAFSGETVRVDVDIYGTEDGLYAYYKSTGDAG